MIKNRYYLKKKLICISFCLFYSKKSDNYLKILMWIKRITITVQYLSIEKLIYILIGLVICKGIIKIIMP